MAPLPRGTHANSTQVKELRTNQAFMSSNWALSCMRRCGFWEKKKKIQDLRRIYVPSAWETQCNCWTHEDERAEGWRDLCAFLQHVALLEGCFLLNCQHCRKNSRKIKEVFKTDGKFIWRLDNLLNNPMPFYQRSNKMQLLGVKVKQTQIRNMIINWHNFSRNTVIHLMHESLK